MYPLIRRYLRRVDVLYLAICVLCSALSVVVLVSLGYSQLGSNNKASVQVIASLLGVMLAIVFSTVDYRALARAWPLHATVAWGLVLPTLFLHNVNTGVLTIGYDAGGTSNYSWYRVGGMTFQPAELAKISFILTLALHLSQLRGQVHKPKNLFFLLIHVIVPPLLIHLQGDDGTALVFLGIGLIMLYAGGLSHWLVGGVLVGGVVGGGALLMLKPDLLKGYQFQRIMAILTPEDPALSDITYQQNKGAMAIGTGGLTGQGLFSGDHIFVPNAWNDFIFAYLANVLGFLGAASVLILLFALCLRTLRTALHQQRRIGPLYLRRHLCRIVCAVRHQSGHEPAGFAGHWRNAALFLCRRLQRSDDVSLRGIGSQCGNTRKKYPAGRRADPVTYVGRAQPAAGSMGTGFRPGFIAHEQAGNQAKGCHPYHDKDSTGQPVQAAAYQPAHSVEAPDSINAPVDAAHNGQQQK